MFGKMALPIVQKQKIWIDIIRDIQIRVRIRIQISSEHTLAPSRADCDSSGF